MEKNGQPPFKSNLALDALSPFIGEWEIEITSISVREDPSAVVRGQSSFAWLEGGAFLIQHSEIADSDFPRSVAVMGPDAAVNAVYANQVAALDPADRDAFVAARREEYLADVDLLRARLATFGDHVLLASDHALTIARVESAIADLRSVLDTLQPTEG